ncbi:MAG: SDR family NAD(P)-dependent oxidoreductase [Chloroflexi bacterium]|nr:SDR family NAD(P)-dependent oxidoreductase [Chloroflexota bacterium]
MSQNRVAIITGASSGIGAASARLLAKEGYRIVLAARRVNLLEEVAIEAAGGDALPIGTDVGDLDSINNMVSTTIKEYGRIDLLFNNAGFGRIKWLEDLDPEQEIAAQIQVNLLGVIQTTRAVLPHMIAQGSGHIINMASMAAFIGTPTYSIYAAAKFGVRGFSEALRREVGVLGLDISVIYPGGVDTEFEQLMGADRKTGIKTPDNLKLSAEDVAQAVVRLARKPRRSVIIPGYFRFAIWLNHFFPRLNDWIIERAFTRRERRL